MFLYEATSRLIACLFVTKTTGKRADMSSVLCKHMKDLSGIQDIARISFSVVLWDGLPDWKPTWRPPNGITIPLLQTEKLMGHHYFYLYYHALYKYIIIYRELDKELLKFPKHD